MSSVRKKNGVAFDSLSSIGGDAQGSSISSSDPLEKYQKKEGILPPTGYDFASTLYVTNVPSSQTDTDVQAILSWISPILYIKQYDTTDDDSESEFEEESKPPAVLSFLIVCASSHGAQKILECPRITLDSSNLKIYSLHRPKNKFDTFLEWLRPSPKLQQQLDENKQELQRVGKDIMKSDAVVKAKETASEAYDRMSSIFSR